MSNPNHDPNTGRFSFTNPDVPLFGPDYEKKKAATDAAFKNLREVLGQPEPQKPEPFSFTRPDVPLFGPTYQHNKKEAEMLLKRAHDALSKIGK
jgi:hypothetical protein